MAKMGTKLWLLEAVAGPVEDGELLGVEGLVLPLAPAVELLLLALALDSALELAAELGTEVAAAVVAVERLALELVELAEGRTVVEDVEAEPELGEKVEDGTGDEELVVTREVMLNVFDVASSSFVSRLRSVKRKDESCPGLKTQLSLCLGVQNVLVVSECIGAEELLLLYYTIAVIRATYRRELLCCQQGILG